MLTIISSNIRFDNPKDGDHQWCFRRRVLSAVLKSHSPALIGTQEGRRPQIEDLQSLLELKMATDHREWIEERMYPTIFYSSQIFDLLESGDFWLSESPWEAGSSSFGSCFPRLCTWAKLRVRKTAKEIFYFNTHLDHLRGDTRQSQAQVLINEMRRICSPDCAILLGGDFNEGPKEQVRKYILSGRENFFDPWKRLNKEEEASHHKFKGEAPHANRIDWLLMTPHFSAFEIAFDRTQIDGISPSDHYPLVVKIN